MNEGVCPGPQIGVVFRRVGLDLGAGQRRGRSEVRVTIDDHHVTHCPEDHADPSHQADVRCGRRVGIGSKEESIPVPEKGQRDQPRTLRAGSRYPRVRRRAQVAAECPLCVDPRFSEPPHPRAYGGIPVLFGDRLTGSQARTQRVRDNRTGTLGDRRDRTTALTPRRTAERATTEVRQTARHTHLATRGR
jgi:hypothetical protein